MKNVGFMLLRERIDYVCFHDVDYLPIWADYSLVDTPTMIVWYGFESRPLDPQQPEKRGLAESGGLPCGGGPHAKGAVRARKRIFQSFLGMGF
jgi:hypothetical protein